MLASLRHPNLVRVYDLGFHQQQPFLVMDLIEGKNLAASCRNDSLEADRCIEIARQVADALATAHKQGVIHRDVNPNNIVLDEAGAPHLIDFGLAHLQDFDTVRTGTEAIAGTVAYMAPEQACGDGEAIGPATDIFCLGATIYYLLTGQAPFAASSHDKALRRARRCEFDQGLLRRSCPDRQLVQAVLRAMAAEPADRYPSMEAFGSDLQQSSRTIRRRWLVVTGLAAAALLSWFNWPVDRDEKPVVVEDPLPPEQEFEAAAADFSISFNLRGIMATTSSAGRMPSLSARKRQVMPATGCRKRKTPGQS